MNLLPRQVVSLTLMLTRKGIMLLQTSLTTQSSYHRNYMQWLIAKRWLTRFPCCNLRAGNHPVTMADRIERSIKSYCRGSKTRCKHREPDTIFVKDIYVSYKILFLIILFCSDKYFFISFNVYEMFISNELQTTNSIHTTSMKPLITDSISFSP